ncbi:MAG: hypothetical protein WCO94_16355 [Verrucomicrobiota bacterium]
MLEGVVPLAMPLPAAVAAAFGGGKRGARGIVFLEEFYVKLERVEKTTKAEIIRRLSVIKYQVASEKCRIGDLAVRQVLAGNEIELRTAALSAESEAGRAFTVFRDGME